MVTKHVFYEINGPESGKDAAQLRAIYTMEWLLAKERRVSSPSEMSYAYVDGSHRFCVAIETEEAA